MFMCYIIRQRDGGAVKLSKETTIKLNEVGSNILGHLCYAASKHWNNLNYERLHYTESGYEKMPDWYEQKRKHKDDFFARNLPSLTAQEVAKLLDKAWTSYFVLKRTGGVKNPRPPRFKQDKIPVTYLYPSIKKINGSTVRLSLPRQLKEHMTEKYGIDDNFLYISNPVFENIDNIKQIKLYPPEKGGETRCIVIYEVDDTIMKEDNGKYLSIDMGINNPLACYSNTTGETFITGRKFFSLERKWLKEIGRVQSIWYTAQERQKVKYVKKSSKHIARLYRKMNNCLEDYIHKVTRDVVGYCLLNDIHTVIVGDITHVRDTFDKGDVLNQKMHSFPFRKILYKLEYKLRKEGIKLVMEDERYSSQCSPASPEVSKKYAEKSKRVKRGLFVDGDESWNADAVGAYNILRLFRQRTGLDICMENIKIPYVRKVAV